MAVAWDLIIIVILTEPFVRAGIPYVTAPMEAEAQCATLEELGLVDGVITDDSDVFLFGAKRVFKNIFEQTKFVESYRSSDIETELHVDRRKLIYLAHLLGSDYAAGVHGIGIVNALEVLAAFPGENGLKEFRAWAKTLGNDPKPPPKQRIGWSDDEDEEDEDAQTAKARRLKAEFKYKHRKARRRWRLGEGFPSPAVLSAYRNPQVEKSSERFSWRTPDLVGLRLFMREKLNWSEGDTDQHLLPVMKELAQQQKAQTRIDGFFSLSYNDDKRAARFKSKRLIEATAAIREQRESSHASAAAANVGEEADGAGDGGGGGSTSGGGGGGNSSSSTGSTDV